MAPFASPCGGLRHVTFWACLLILITTSVGIAVHGTVKEVVESPVHSAGRERILRNVHVKPASPSELETRGLRVALVGDSITFGSGNLSEFTKLGEERLQRIAWRGSYPATVQTAFKHCGSGHEEVRMFALGGTTGLTPEHLSRDGRHFCSEEKHGTKPSCSFWDTEAFQGLLKFKPEVVILGLGTNDGKEDLEILRKNFGADMSALVARIGARKTFVLVPAPVRETKFRISNKALHSVIRPTLKGLPAQIQAASPNMDVSTIDLADVLADDRAYGGKAMSFFDGVHPSQRGTFALSQCVLSRMLTDGAHDVGTVKDWSCDRPSDCCGSTWCAHDQALWNLVWSKMDMNTAIEHVENVRTRVRPY